MITAVRYLRGKECSKIICSQKLLRIRVEDKLKGYPILKKEDFVIKADKKLNETIFQEYVRDYKRFL